MIALVYLSDAVLSKLGILVGRDRECDVLNTFGVGIMSGIGFPGEALGRLFQTTCPEKGGQTARDGRGRPVHPPGRRQAGYGHCRGGQGNGLWKTKELQAIMERTDT